ncbi:MAG: YjjG family noncanonical pyrimidine nucleotidase [Bacteroidetes bacterium]|nr:YjjG family noncanonical pyrimidine nucleotidase [Bacteroidota bacterium]
MLENIPSGTMKYKHLFFDLDHTLWDFETASRRSWEQLWDIYNLSNLLDTDFEQFYAVYTKHNDELWRLFQQRKIDRELLRWKRIWNAFLEFNVYDRPLAEQISNTYLDILPNQAALIPHAKELLEHCKGRYQMHLITNGFERTQKQKIQVAGIADYFQEIITSELSDSIKPQPEIFLFALKATQARLEESLMIGDAYEADILGAIGVGMDTVYFNPAKVVPERRPTFQIECLKELIEIL